MKNMEFLNKEQIYQQISSLYAKYGGENYVGELISQQEHAIQAALQAEKEGQESVAIIGALLHDIGHILGLEYGYESMASYGTVCHESIGSEYLKQLGFNELTRNLVLNHVKAKRYLVSKIEGYYEKLSEASKQTFIFQGGFLSDEEIKEFVKDPNFNLYIKMRHWDDQAKIVGMEIPEFSYFKNHILKSIIII